MNKSFKIVLAISIIIIMLLPYSVIAGSISIPVHSLGIIYPPEGDSDNENGLKILLRFEIPDSLTEKRITYSEIMLPFQITRFRDTTFSVDVYAITSSWSEDSVSWEFPWHSEGGDMDSVSVFRRYITLGDNNTHALDLTQLVKDWVYEDRVNHGFAIAINFPDRRGLRFNIDRLLPFIRNRLSLEITISP